MRPEPPHVSSNMVQLLSGGDIEQLLVSHLSQDGNGPYTLVEGRVAPTVSAVNLVLSDGRQVTATTGGGWLVAWWPGSQNVTPPRSRPPAARRPSPSRHLASLSLRLRPAAPFRLTACPTDLPCLRLPVQTHSAVAVTTHLSPSEQVRPRTSASFRSTSGRVFNGIERMCRSFPTGDWLKVEGALGSAESGVSVTPSLQPGRPERGSVELPATGGDALIIAMSRNPGRVHRIAACEGIASPVHLDGEVIPPGDSPTYQVISTPIAAATRTRLGSLDRHRRAAMSCLQHRSQ